MSNQGTLNLPTFLYYGTLDDFHSEPLHPYYKLTNTAMHVLMQEY